MACQKTPERHIQLTAVVAIILFLMLNALVSTHVPLTAQTLDAKAIQASDNEKRLQGPWPFWISRNFLMREKAPDVVIFGSSQMGSAHVQR